MLRKMKVNEKLYMEMSKICDNHAPVLLISLVSQPLTQTHSING